MCIPCRTEGLDQTEGLVHCTGTREEIMVGYSYDVCTSSSICPYAGWCGYAEHTSSGGLLVRRCRHLSSGLKADIRQAVYLRKAIDDDGVALLVLLELGAAG